MMEDVDMHGGEVSLPKDLPNGNANAVGCVNGHGNGNRVVSVDSVEADLKSNSGEFDSQLVVVEESKPSSIINNGEDKIDSEKKEESVIVISENRVNNFQDEIEPEKEESLAVVTGGDVDQDNEVEHSPDKEGCSGDDGIDVDQNLEDDAESGMQAVDGQPKDVVSESVAVNGSVDQDQDQGAEAQNDSSENVESLPADLPAEIACENGIANVAVEIYVAHPVGELEAESEQNPEAVSFPVADAQLDSQVVNGSATDESEQVSETSNTQNGPLSSQVVSGSVTEESKQVLVIGNAQDGDLETVVNDFVDASPETTKLNKSLEVGERVPSPVDSENVPVESVQVDACQPTMELHKSLEIGEILRSSADSGNLPVEIVQMYPATPASINDITAEPDAGFAASAVTENSPSCEVNGKLEMQSSEISDSNPVENTNVTEVENDPIGDGSVSACPNNDARSEIETVADSSVSACPNNDARSEIETVADSSSSLEVDGVKGETENGRLELQSSESSDSHLVDSNNVIEVENGHIGDGSVSGCPNYDARSEIETVAENSPYCMVDDVKRETENGKLEMRSNRRSDSHPVNNTIEFENSPIADDRVSGYHNNDASSEIENAHASTETEEKVGDDFHTKSEVSELTTECVDEQPILVDNAVVESSVTDSIEKESGANVKSESEIENESSASCTDVPGDDVVVSETVAPCGSVTGVENGGIQSTGDESDDQRSKEVEEHGEIQFAKGKSDDKTCQEVKENGVSQIDGEENGNKRCQEVEDIDGIHRDETATSTLEGSTADTSETQNAGPEVVKRPFYFLVKVPRCDEEKIREQIKSAQSQVDEKTRSRDAIRDEVQAIRATCKKYGESLEAALSEERGARELLKSKRQEIDSLQSKINKMKNAISVEDINGRIRNMEHMIAHETLPLKEEKQFIRDIKQLKQLREQFSSSMGEQDEVQQALDQKDQIEEQMKLLRKEADSLRDNVLKAEAATQASKKQQRIESEKLKKLLGQFKAADDFRQEAYKHLHSLKKQVYDKNKYFWKYKDDAKQANDLAFKGDAEALQNLCFNQVESVLEVWNSNDEFRKEYVNSNIRSTLRRLKTLDGRSLGPDEETPVIRTYVNDRVAKDNAMSQISASKSEKTEQSATVKPEKVDTKPIPEVGEQKNHTTKSKRPAKSPLSVNGSAAVSGRDEIEEVIVEEPKRTKEEEEIARKAEELRKEKEAAKLKAQRRLEEKAKAKEALERKKRIAEKAQARAALRAQKEAEQKEKEREKKARKKEKKKAAATEDTDLKNEEESTPSLQTPSATPRSSEVQEKSMTVTKRSQKILSFTKQTTKAKSIPLPLRNRGKRRMQSWMWALIAALAVFALFLLGNGSFPSKFGLEGFGF